MAMEVIDKYCVAAIEENFAFGLPPDAGAILLVAVDGSREEVERSAAVIEQIIEENGGFGTSARRPSNEEEDKLWDVRRAISPSLMKYGTLKSTRTSSFRVRVCPSSSPASRRSAKQHDTFVANFGHAGDGNIHVNFVVDRDDADAVARARECVGRDLSALGRSRRHDLRRARHRLCKIAIPALRPRRNHARHNASDQKSLRPERDFESGENVSQAARKNYDHCHSSIYKMYSLVVVCAIAFGFVRFGSGKENDHPRASRRKGNVADDGRQRP